VKGPLLEQLRGAGAEVVRARIADELRSGARIVYAKEAAPAGAAR
jgi:hypothetical protein